MNAAGLTPALCQEALDGVGSGVAMSLRAVDCAAAATSQAAFGRLFASDGALLPALTIMLTLYVAFFAFGLITGRSTLGISALTPRMVTLGLVLTFATSWAAYQGTMYNLVIGAPNQIANILTGTEGSATTVFADKIDVVFAALIEASGDEAMEGGAPSTFSPPGLLWLGGTLLLLGTVGLLATCKIALAILMALGPIFVVLALFNGTRGLFTGWLKGVVLLAITPLFAVLGGSLMLELAVPVLRALTVVPGEIEPRAAMAFFMIGAVHMALMIMVLKVAGTMVGGWTVFGLAGRGDKADNAVTAAAAARGAATAVVAANPANPARGTAAAPSREIRLNAASLPSAANDRGASSTLSTRETRIIGAAGAGTGSSNADAAGPSRARGIGSRFRAAPPRASKSRTTP